MPIVEKADCISPFVMLFEPSLSIILNAWRIDSFECFIALNSRKTPCYYFDREIAPPLLIFLMNYL